MDTFNVGDKVVKKDGFNFSNGEPIVTIGERNSTCPDNHVTLMETGGTHISVDDIKLAPPSTPDANPSDLALRFNGGKPKLSIIPRSALVALACVLEKGAIKYARDNWRKGLPFTEVLDSCMRHIQSFNTGEDTDEETGESHLAHAMANLVFLIEYMETGSGNDDRYIPQTVGEQ